MKTLKNWTIEPYINRPWIGGRWYRGNYSLGILFDSHPQFVNVTLALVLIEIGVAFKRI